MLIIRWRRWAWTRGMPLLVAAPFAGMLGWRGEVCYDSCAAATVGGGVWQHLVDLRAARDLAELARDHVGLMTPMRRWHGWRSLRAGEWVTHEGVAIGFSPKGELGSIDPNSVGGGGSLLNQTGGNIEILMAGRQNMPASAEMIAAIAGTRGALITAQQTHIPAPVSSPGWALAREGGST